MQKLHVGCGNKNLPGYIHIDVTNYPHLDHVWDITKLDELFKKNTIDEIYACHVFEHISRRQIFDVLCRWHKILKPGGKLRLSVPDFEAITEYYLETQKLEDICGLLAGGQKDEWDYHHIQLDFRVLSSILKDVGFDEIERYDWREFLPQNFDDYSRAYIPHMNENGKLMSLNVLAVKHERVSEKGEITRKIIKE